MQACAVPINQPIPSLSLSVALMKVLASSNALDGVVLEILPVRDGQELPLY